MSKIIDWLSQDIRKGKTKTYQSSKPLHFTGHAVLFAVKIILMLWGASILFFFLYAFIFGYSG